MLKIKQTVTQLKRMLSPAITPTLQGFSYIEMLHYNFKHQEKNKQKTRIFAPLLYQPSFAGGPTGHDLAKHNQTTVQHTKKGYLNKKNRASNFEEELKKGKQKPTCKAGQPAAQQL